MVRESSGESRSGVISTCFGRGYLRKLQRAREVEMSAILERLSRRCFVRVGILSCALVLLTTPLFAQVPQPVAAPGCTEIGLPWSLNLSTTSNSAATTDPHWTVSYNANTAPISGAGTAYHLTSAEVTNMAKPSTAPWAILQNWITFYSGTLQSNNNAAAGW